MKYAVATLSFLVAFLPANLRADQFDVSWSGLFGNGSAVLNATNEGGGAYLITSMTDATQDGLAITLLGTDTYPNNVPTQVNDNIIYPGENPLLDDSGFSFTDGTYNYDIFFPSFQEPPNLLNTYYECSSGPPQDSNCEGLAFDVAGPLSSFDLTPVPEPASMLLFCTGLFGLMGVGLRRKFVRLSR